MKVIELTKGYAAIVDDEDFERVAQWRWCALVGKYTVYAMRNSGKKGFIYMHRFLMNAPSGAEVDHKNGNGIDNRRTNLRLGTKAQNQHNSKCKKHNKLGVKGVTFIKSTGKFHAKIRANKKTVFSAYFKTVEAAKAARDVAVQQHHGEFARLN